MRADTRVGAVEVIRPSAVLSGTYVSSNPVDLENHNSVVIEVEATVAQAATTVNLKFQWGIRDVTGTIQWTDETALADSAVSGTELPQTPYSRRVDLSIASTGIIYKERFNRLARFFRIQAKSSGVTTGKIEVRAQNILNP